MNVGIILVAFILLIGSVLGIAMIAAANQAPVVDSFGQTQTNQTNETAATIGNVTAPLSQAGGGLILLMAAFLLFIAAIYVVKSISSNNSGRR